MKSGILFYLIGLTIIIFSCQSDDAKKKSHFESGMKYYQSKEYKKAVIEFKNAVKIDNNYINALTRLGDSMLKLGNISEAFRAYSRVEKIDPENLDALINLSKFFFLGKQNDKALERVEKILLKDDKNIEALYIKAQILFGKKEFDKALTYYLRILEIKNDHLPAMKALASIKIMKRDYDEAEKILKKAVKSDPKNSSPRFSLAGFYLGRGFNNKSKSVLIKAAKDIPDNPDVHIYLGNFYYKFKNYELAENSYKKSIKVSASNIKPFVVLAGFYELRKDYEKASKTYEDALKVNPENMFLKITSARYLFKRGKIAESEKKLDELLTKRPDLFPAKMLKSEICIYKKEFNKALSLLNELELEEPESARIFYFKALAYLGLGKNLRAGSEVSKSVDLDPDFYKAGILQAEIYFYSNSYKLAEKKAETLLKRRPDDLRVLNILSGARLALGKNREAEKDLLYITKIYPENHLAYYRLALIKAYEKDYKNAHLNLDKCENLNNEFQKALTLKVRLMIEENKLNKAHEVCDNRIKKSSSKKFKALAYNLKGSLYRIEGKKDDAIKAFNSSIENDSEYISSYNALASAYLSKSDSKKAIKQYELIIKKRPDIPQPNMMMGTIYEMEKNFDMAEKNYREALKKDPDFAPAANNLAYHLVNRSDKYDEALKYARLAKSVLPEDPSVMDTLGLVYYKKGLYGNAVGEFKDSIEKYPKNPLVHYHLGLAYEKKGESGLAKEELLKALNISSSFKGSDHAKEMIEKLNKG